MEGIGEVVLTTKKLRGKTGRDSQGLLTLKNVLYSLGAVCNIFGLDASDDHGVVLGRGGKVSDKSGTTRAITRCPYLFRLRLAGQSASQTSFDKEAVYMINANWPVSEQKRWRDFNQNKAVKQTHESASKAMQAESPPYTRAEKDWLKKHFGGEFHFLQTYTLSIYKDEDREEGQLIARALIEGDIRGDTENVKPKESSSSSKTRVQGPDAHSTDRHFTNQQLDWIEHIYGSSTDSFAFHGLRPSNDNHCKKGVALVEVFMRDKAEDDEDDERSSFEREIDEIPESHFVDYYFADEQLQRIKRH